MKKEKYLIQSKTHTGFVSHCTKDILAITDSLERAKKFNSYETAERFVDRANERWDNILTITRVAV